jgi:hypothetical protein
MNSEEIKEKIYEGGVHFKVILEMMGKPKEHVEETFKQYLEQLKKNEHITVLEEEFNEPKEVEGGMFSSFVEMELLADDLSNVVWFCFDYMPSSVEVYEPQELKYKSHDFTDFLNDLQARLHQMDMTVKTVNATNLKLNKNAESLLRNSIALSIELGRDTPEEISKSIGVHLDGTKNILNQLEMHGALIQSGGKYSVKKKE